MAPVVLITGINGGIGQAIADVFSKHGYTVVGAARHTEETHYPCVYMDYLSPDTVRQGIAQVLHRFGRIDVLVQSAGAGIGGALEDYSDSQLTLECSLHLTGAALVDREVLPSMRQAGRGRIIHIGSVAARIPIPFQALYSASKAGLGALSDALRLELRGTGVQVTTVEPGDTQTGFTGSRHYAAGMAKNSSYQDPCQRSLNAMMYDEQHGKSPKTVADTVYRLCQKKKMPRRKVVCLSYKLLVLGARLLPAALVEWILTQIYLKSKKDGGFRYPS